MKKRVAEVEYIKTVLGLTVELKKAGLYKTLSNFHVDNAVDNVVRNVILAIVRLQAQGTLVTHSQFQRPMVHRTEKIRAGRRAHVATDLPGIVQCCARHCSVADVTGIKF